MKGFVKVREVLEVRIIFTKSEQEKAREIYEKYKALGYECIYYYQPEEDAAADDQGYFTMTKKSLTFHNLKSIEKQQDNENTHSN